MKVFLIHLIEAFFSIRNIFFNKGDIDYKVKFRKILLVSTRPLGYGDLIMSTPFIRSLRDSFPDSKIHIATDKDIFDQVDEIDDVHLLRGGLFDLIIGFIRLRSENFDLSIVMNRGINQAFYLECLNSKYRLGYIGKKFRVLSNFNLYKNNLIFRKDEHFSKMSLHIAESLGIKVQKSFINLNFKKQLKDKVNTFYNLLNINNEKPLIALNTFVLWKSRRWNENKYIELVERLHNRFNFVLFGGNDSIKLNNLIQEKLAKNKIYIENISGMLQPKESMLFLRKIDLFVTSDSGPMHFSLIMKRPTLALFGPVNPINRLPMIKEKKNIYSYLWYNDYRESGSYNYESKYVDVEMNGLNVISVDDVEEKILKFFINRCF